MDALAPYVEAKEHHEVRAWMRGFAYDAVVIGWRGDRLYLSWHTDMGRHLGWVPAADVERR